MRLRFALWLLAAAGVASLARSVGAQAVIADSFEDWSTTGLQGEKNWFYGYYDVTEDQTNGDGIYQTDEFIEFFNNGTNICEAQRA